MAFQVHCNLALEVKKKMCIKMYEKEVIERSHDVEASLRALITSVWG